MANRVRNRILKFFVSEKEEELIKRKMNCLEMSNFSDYARKMILDGYIVRKDYSNLRSLLHEANKVGVNINQISHRINEQNTIYKTDLKTLKNYIEELKKQQEMKFMLSKDYRAVKTLNLEIATIQTTLNKLIEDSQKVNRSYAENMGQLNRQMEEIWQLLRLSLSKEV